MRRFVTPPVALLSLLAFAPPLQAQAVRGQVADSTTHVPLAGAAVVLLNAEGEEVGRAEADHDGLFTLRAPEPGEYQLRVEYEGYRTSLFPTFTLEADEAKGFLLLVSDQQAEAPETSLMEQLCAAGAVKSTEAALFGLVRDGATGEPAPGVQVNISWPAVSGQAALAAPGQSQDLVATLTTGDNGYYVACGLPAFTVLTVNASQGELLSDFAAVQFDSAGVYGNGELHSSDEPVWQQDLELLPPDRRAGTVTGAVVDKDESQPVAGATVRIANTPLQTTTSPDGSFTVSGVPAGPIQLWIENTGFAPLRHDVTLQPGESVALPKEQLALVALAPELVPVMVEGASDLKGLPKLADFWAREARGGGSFITRDEYQDRGVHLITEVLRLLQGIWIHNNPDYGSTGVRWLVSMSRGGPQTFRNPERRCPPLYFLDGAYIGDAETVDIDQTLSLSEVVAIEAYNSVSAIPREYNRTGARCGVIAFWTE
jgi:hypothetical protein